MHGKKNTSQMFHGVFKTGLDWTGLDEDKADNMQGSLKNMFHGFFKTELDWTRLGSTGLDWIPLDSTGLD